jgi:hypothetical protein
MEESQVEHDAGSVSGDAKKALDALRQCRVGFDALEASPDAVGRMMTIRPDFGGGAGIMGRARATVAHHFPGNEAGSI